MNKGTLFLLFSIVLLGGAVALLSSLQGGTLQPVLPSLEGGTEAKTAEQAEEKETALLQVALEVEGERYDIGVPLGSTVYDLMAKAQEQEHISFSGREFADLGFFVEAINGKSQSNRERKYWIYYINRQKAQMGVSWYQPQPYDVISFKYEDEE